MVPGERHCGDAGTEKTIEELALEPLAGEAPVELGGVGLQILGRDDVMDAPTAALISSAFTRSSTCILAYMGVS